MLHNLKIIFNTAGATFALFAVYYVGSAILALVG